LTSEKERKLGCRNKDRNGDKPEGLWRRLQHSPGKGSFDRKIDKKRADSPRPSSSREKRNPVSQKIIKKRGREKDFGPGSLFCGEETPFRSRGMAISLPRKKGRRMAGTEPKKMGWEKGRGF